LNSYLHAVSQVIKEICPCPNPMKLNHSIDYVIIWPYNHETRHNGNAPVQSSIHDSSVLRAALCNIHWTTVKYTEKQKYNPKTTQTTRKQLYSNKRTLLYMHNFKKINPKINGKNAPRIWLKMTSITRPPRSPNFRYYCSFIWPGTTVKYLLLILTENEFNEFN